MKNIKDYVGNHNKNIYTADFYFVDADLTYFKEEGWLYYWSPMLRTREGESITSEQQARINDFINQFKDSKWIMIINPNGDATKRMVAIDLMCDDQKIIETLSELEKNK